MVDGDDQRQLSTRGEIYTVPHKESWRKFVVGQKLLRFDWVGVVTRCWCRAVNCLTSSPLHKPLTRIKHVLCHVNKLHF